MDIHPHQGRGAARIRRGVSRPDVAVPGFAINAALFLDHQQAQRASGSGQGEQHKGKGGKDASHGRYYHGAAKAWQSFPAPLSL